MSGTEKIDVSKLSEAEREVLEAQLHELHQGGLESAVPEEVIPEGQETSKKVIEMPKREPQSSEVLAVPKPTAVETVSSVSEVKAGSNVISGESFRQAAKAIDGSRALKD